MAATFWSSVGLADVRVSIFRQPTCVSPCLKTMSGFLQLEISIGDLAVMLLLKCCCDHVFLKQYTNMGLWV